MVSADDATATERTEYTSRQGRKTSRYQGIRAETTGNKAKHAGSDVLATSRRPKKF